MLEHVVWKNQEKPKYQFGGLCSIDAVLRQSRLKNGAKDQYTKRFLIHMKTTIQAVSEMPEKYQSQIKKIFREWQKQGIYTSKDIEGAGGELYVYNEVYHYSIPSWIICMFVAHIGLAYMSCFVRRSVMII